MEYPRLRNVEIFPLKDEGGRQLICFRDPLRFTKDPLLLPYHSLLIISLLDGKHSLRDIQAEYMRKHGELIYLDAIEKVVKELNDHLLLDNEQFQEYRIKIEENFHRSPLRSAAHAGMSYEADPEKLRRQLEEFFISLNDLGEATARNPKKPIKGAVAPHIDLKAGGACFAYAYREIKQYTNADLFVIFGTSHYEAEGLFSLTLKDFETPLGIAKTDKELVNKIAKSGGGDSLLRDSAHRLEHSIEFQVIFLQHIFAGERDFSIVPILCSSFQEMIMSGASPAETTSVRGFIEALKDTLSSSKREVCMIAGADLSHIGIRYGDPSPPSLGFLEEVKAEDLGMLKCAENIDAEGFYRSVQKDLERRRICGLPPIYTLLKVIEAERGEVLKYDWWKDVGNSSAVSFTSMVFY